MGSIFFKDFQLNELNKTVLKSTYAAASIHQNNSFKSYQVR